MSDYTNILVIEDNDITADLYKRLLERAGYSVAIAPDTETASELLATEDIHMVILDYELPDQIGPIWLTHLRSNNTFEKLPVILVSAIERETDLRTDPYVWFMEKPRQPQLIVTAVESTIQYFKSLT